MITFTLAVICENAAFDPDYTDELSRILKDIAKRIKQSESGIVRDINGNVVGKYEVQNV